MFERHEAGLAEPAGLEVCFERGARLEKLDGDHEAGTQSSAGCSFLDVLGVVVVEQSGHEMVGPAQIHRWKDAGESVQ